MSSPVITVENLAKHYVIGHESRHDNLRDTLHHTARKLWRRFRWGTGFQTEEFWALRDVSFAVTQGEVVGIIGRNGAGKSTLLKILSRITEPTSGRVAIRGRVASLLEVGTGFHPELSGRENIFLNGAILGMSRAEIRRKFDEIVAFAEVAKFLDTPVKHYSSGMYVRLAFAVAAHLEPEILIVDEVLAVGDVAFQKKCLGKMQDVARNEGRTVLFVSHQNDAVRALCQRCIWLSDGRISREGNVNEVIRAYMDSGLTNAPQLITGARGTRLISSSVSPSDDGAGLMIRLEFESAVELRAPKIGLVINDAEHRPVLGTNTQMHAPAHPVPAGRRYRAQVHIPLLPLHGDSYRVSVFVGDRDEHLLTVDNACQFHWTPPRPVLHRPSLKEIGPVNTEAEWKFLDL